MNRSEALTIPPDVEPPGDYAARIQDKNDTGTCGFGPRTSEMAKLALQLQSQSKLVSDAGRDRSEGQSDWSQVLEDVLPRRWFIKHLQNEQRRTDRSKVPASIVLFRFDKKSSGLGDVNGLVSVLRDAKRETDVLGYLAGDLIGLLLTDTDEQGVQGFTQKIAARVPDMPFTTISGTYPGQHLVGLIAENEELPDSYLPLLEGTVRDGYSMKRTLDIVGSIIAIVLFSPVMLLAAFAVAVTSPGPIILKQLRLGKNGIPFVFYKFRSMLVNGDDRIHREYVTSLINGKLEETNQGNAARPLYKIVSDPRVTTVGRIIRKASIDELPQLFNVLRGDMSLVGPRPPLSYEAENYQSWHLRRILEAKPGMTGLWQVEGRSRTSFDEMVRMDLRYIQNCSLTFDLKILIKTIKVVFRCEGAN